jgi:hypothetical protein
VGQAIGRGEVCVYGLVEARPSSAKAAWLSRANTAP